MKTLVAVVAALAVGGGVAYAAIPDAGKVYHACMLKGIGTIRMIDTEKQQRCSALESEITWNQRGEQGGPGAAGSPGADGASPTVTQLAAGDAHCAAGGAAITDAKGATAYVCSGQNGQNGKDGKDGAPFAGTFTSPNGQYTFSVTNSGVSVAGAGGLAASFSDAGIAVQSPGTLDLLVGGNTSLSVGGSLGITTGSATSITTGSSLSLLAGSSLAVTANGGASFDVGSAFTLHTGSNATFTVGQNLQMTAASNFAAQAGGTGLLKAAGVLTLQGSTINEN
jgi:hypothetical protein